MSKRPLNLMLSTAIDFDNYRPAKWVTDTTSLLENVPRYPSGAGDRGINQTRSYDEFVWIIYKYASMLKMRLRIDADLNNPQLLYITFIGETLNPNALGDRRRLFLISLNDAMENGVGPETLKFFRNIYYIPDDNKKFLAPYQEL